MKIRFWAFSFAFSAAFALLINHSDSIAQSIDLKEADTAKVFNFSNSKPNTEFKAGTSYVLIVLGEKPGLGTVLLPADKSHSAITVISPKKPKLNIKYRSADSPDTQIVFSRTSAKNLEYKGKKFGLDILTQNGQEQLVQQQSVAVTGSSISSTTSSITSSRSSSSAGYLTSSSVSSASSSSVMSGGSTNAVLWCTDLTSSSTSFDCAPAELAAGAKVLTARCEPGCSGGSVSVIDKTTPGSSCTVTVEQVCCGGFFDPC